MTWYNSLWLWRWLPHRLSKCLSLSTTVLFRISLWNDSSLCYTAGPFLGIKTIESVLADVSFVGNFSLLLMKSLTTASFSKVYFIFFKAVCKDILSLLECYKATLYADKCRRRRWKEGCEFTCCKCDKFRYILWHIVFNQNFIKNETRIFFVVLQAWQDIAIKTWAQSPRPQLFKS